MLSKKWDFIGRMSAMAIVCFILVSALSVPLYAQSGSDELREWLSGAVSDAAFLKWQDYIRAKEASERTSLTLSAGLTADAGVGTGHVRNPFEIQRGLVAVGIRADRGLFPDELSFNFKSQMEVQGGIFREYVSAMTLSYDRYLSERLEIFGFFERFSNAYLHLAQRYEIGLGGKAEFNLFPDSRDNDEIRRSRDLIPGYEADLLAELAACEAVEALFNTPAERRSLPDAAANAAALFPGDRFSETDWERKIRAALQDIGAGYDPLSRPSPEVLAALNSRLKFLKAAHSQLRRISTKMAEVEYAGKKRTARLSLGVSTAMFYEADSSLAEWRTTEDLPVVPSALTLPAEQRFRLSVRPSVSWRPYPNLKFDGRYYFKLPLFGDTVKTSLFDGKAYRDIRHDARFVVKYEPFLEWTRSLGISFEYDYAFDNIPPYLDAGVMRAAIASRPEFDGLGRDAVLAALRKDQSHGQARINLLISF